MEPANDRARARRASLSLDLDNLWSYLKVRGEPGWSTFPTYLEPITELVIDRLRAHGLTITIFVVGQDAALRKNAAALRALADAGHEIANHSFSHEPWFHSYSRRETEREIADAEIAIERATGQRPRGFRGPGFSVSGQALRILMERGYLYDASTLPTYIGPLARAYYLFDRRELSKDDRARRGRLFGTMRDGLRDIRPYLWTAPPRAAGLHRARSLGRRAAGPPPRLLEIPVTTLPWARVPIHLSYIGFLAARSQRVATAYLRAALAVLCRRGMDLSFLLHPLDFMGGDRIDRLGFFPGMGVATYDKLRLFDEVVSIIKESFEPVTMSEHARVLLDGRRLKTATLG